MNNKIDNLMQYVINQNIDIFFITETWLSENNNHTTAVIKSYGYKIAHYFRPGMSGGGAAIVYKHHLKVVKVVPKHAKSFESVSAKVKLHDNSWRFCFCVYRTGPVGSFISDFDEFLSDVFTYYDRLLICGDINIHLDNEQLLDTKKFIDLIESYGMFQLVDRPAHKAGHILDVVISTHKVVSGNNVNVINNVNEHNNVPKCDHFPLSFSIAGIPSISDNIKTIQFRNIKSISMIQFCQDVKKLLHKKPEDKDLPFPEMISLFNESCTQALNSHAPLLTKKIKDLPSTPGFDSQYKKQERE